MPFSNIRQASNAKVIRAILFWLGFIALFVLVNDNFGKGAWPDVMLYSEYSQNILSGQFPYIDFSVEYPPGSFLAMLLPQLIAQGDLPQYQNWFVVQNVIFVFLEAICLVDLQQGIEPQAIAAFLAQKIKYIVPIGAIALVILWLSPLVFFVLFVLGIIWQVRQSDALSLEVKKMLAVYGLYCFILTPILIWRYDFFVALLIIGMLVCFRRFHYVLAGIFLALGFLAKLYPIMMVPPLVLYFLVQRKYQSLLRGAIAFTTTCTLFMAPFLLKDATQTFSFLQYHQERPFQIESLVSGIALSLSQLNLIAAEPIMSHSSLGLTFAGDHALLQLIPWVFVVSCALGSYWIWQCFSRVYKKLDKIPLPYFIDACLLMHLIFIVSNKVFSPQYIIWLIPFAVFSQRKGRIIFFVTCLLTILIFPTFYDKLTDSISVSTLLNIRNLTMIFWIYLLLDHFGKKQEKYSYFHSIKECEF